RWFDFSASSASRTRALSRSSRSSIAGASISALRTPISSIFPHSSSRWLAPKLAAPPRSAWACSVRAGASARSTACPIALSRLGRSQTKRSINSSISDSFPGIESRRRSIRARLIAPSQTAPFAAYCSGAACEIARELLLFARLIVAPLADGFVAQPPHEAIERRAADTETTRGFGPIAFGLGQRPRDSLAGGLVQILAQTDVAALFQGRRTASPHLRLVHHRGGRERGVVGVRGACR